MQMKMHKKWISILLALVIVFTPLANAIAALPEETFTYEPVTGGVKITGFIAGQETTDLVVPDTLGGEPVVEIDAKAFFQKNLNAVTLGANVLRIGEYAFAANNLSSITLPTALATIDANAFRDNKLTAIDLQNVTAVGANAFSNNKLGSANLRSATSIGDAAFSNSQLTTVSVPESVTSFGSQVFAYNDRYVLVTTSNPSIQTEVVEGGFGHVVNPVMVTIESIDQATGAKIIADQVIGDDYQSLDGIVILNSTNQYTPISISGYRPLEASISYVPNTTDFVLQVFYESTTVKPTIEVTGSLNIPLNGDGSQAALLALVTASDFEGTDITNLVTVTPAGIDTSQSGPVSITYSVTDKFGNTQTKTVDAYVGNSWFEFPIGNGWVLGDFTYNANSVTGFSTSGLEKVQTEKNLVLPHINPNDGLTVIDTVAVNRTDATSFRSKGLTSVSDYNDNIRFLPAKYDAYSATLREPVHLVPTRSRRSTYLT